MLKKIKFITAILISSVAFLYCSKEGTNSNSYAGNQTGQGGSLARFAIVGNYLYTVDKENLTVFAISNAASPQFIKTTKVGFEIETIFPFKDKLFIGSTSVVHIFSIANPENPAKLSQAISPTVLRRCDPVVAKDTVAYATLRVNGQCGGVQSILAAYDVKDVLNPIQRSTVNISEPYGLGYKDNVLYVCDRQTGLRVYDISNAYTPVQLKVIRDNDWYIDVIPYGNVLICWTQTGALLYDITDNRNPSFLASIQ